jgi:peptide/nickel transport system substrate-binding protein
VSRSTHLEMEQTLSRRRLLGTTAGGVAAGMLAGIPGTAVTAQDGGTEFHSAWPYQDQGSGGHFNQFVANGILNPPNIYGDLVWVPMGMLYWASNEWVPLLATEWSFITTGSGAATPGASPAASPAATPSASPAGQVLGAGIDPNADTLQVRLREGVMWSNGQPVTAQDVVDTFDILRFQANTVWDYLSSVEALDDYTLNFHMGLPATVVERYVIRHSPLPAAIYGEWAQRARDLFAAGATSEDPEWKQLTDQFNAFRPEELVVNGPYTIDIASITGAQFSMPKNDTSFWAGQAKFDRIVNFNGETDTIAAVVLSKEIDYATHGFPPATEQSMVDSGIRILRPPRYSGASLTINHGQLPEFADKRVRQALAHAIDRSQTGLVSFGESGVGLTYMTGMSEHFVDSWLDDEVATGLNPYEYDLDKATALMEEAGWTKDGDVWKKPDGSEASYELIFAVEFYLATGQDLAEQLTAFGIRTTAQPITFTQVPVDVEEGRFQLAVRDWGNSTNPHPHFAFASTFFNDNARTDDAVNRGMDFPLVQETDVAGEVDIEQLIVASGEGLDLDGQRDQINLISQIFNELLPRVPIFELYGNNPGLEGVRVQAWPPDDDPIYLNSPYADGIPTMLMLTGWLEPVQG